MIASGRICMIYGSSNLFNKKTLPLFFVFISNHAKGAGKRYGRSLKPSASFRFQKNDSACTVIYMKTELKNIYDDPAHTAKEEAIHFVKCIFSSDAFSFDSVSQRA